MIRALVGALSCILLATRAAMAQQIDIESQPTCKTCIIVFDSVVVLRDAQLEGPNTLIQRDVAGRFILAHPSGQYVKVFSPTGELLGNVGRRGGGPGEYEMVRNIVPTPEGTLFIVDGGLSRLSRFTLDGRFLGSVPLNLQGGLGQPAVLVAQGQILANSAANIDATGRGNNIVLIDDTGRLTGFDSVSQIDQRAPWQSDRLLSFSVGRWLLIASPYLFQINLYKTSRSPERTLRLQARWIPSKIPSVSPSAGIFDTPVTPRLTAVWEDENGRIWFSALAPAKQWKPAPELRPGEQISRERLLELSRRKRIDHLIGVIDPTTMSMLALQRLPQSEGAPFAGGYFAKPKVSGDNVGLAIARARIRP